MRIGFVSLILFFAFQAGAVGACDGPFTISRHTNAGEQNAEILFFFRAHQQSLSLAQIILLIRQLAPAESIPTDRQFFPFFSQDRAAIEIMTATLRRFDQLGPGERAYMLDLMPTAESRRNVEANLGL